MEVKATLINLTDGDMEIIDAIKKAHKESQGYHDAINKIWADNKMFVDNPKRADENEELKELNYKATLVTMRITSLNEALVERILEKVL